MAFPLPLMTAMISIFALLGATQSQSSTTSPVVIMTTNSAIAIENSSTKPLEDTVPLASTTIVEPQPTISENSFSTTSAINSSTSTAGEATVTPVVSSTAPETTTVLTATTEITTGAPDSLNPITPGDNYSSTATFSSTTPSNRNDSTTTSGNFSTSTPSGNLSTSTPSGNLSTSTPSGNYSTSTPSGNFSTSTPSGNLSTSTPDGNFSTSTPNFSTAGNISTARTTTTLSSTTANTTPMTTSSPGTNKSSTTLNYMSTTARPGAGNISFPSKDATPHSKENYVGVTVGAIVGTALGISLVALVLYFIFKKAKSESFNHRRLYEDVSADPVLRLDSSADQLDLRYEGCYNPGVTGDSIQMANIHSQGQDA